MTARKTFLDDLPAVVQIVLLVAVSFIFGVVFGAVSLPFIRPLFNVSGFDVVMQMSNDFGNLAGDMNAINAVKFIQLISTLGMFLLPALLYAMIRRGDYIRARRGAPWFWFAAALVLILVSQPFASALYALNMKMNLHWDWLMNAIRNSEDRAAEITKLFLQMPAPRDLLINLFLIAMLPAIGEEFFFRGVVQRIIHERSRNVHLAVWITAAVFSFVHFQFLGFLPRMFLGVLLGYLYAYSGSIWVSVTGHVINNGSQVLLSYMHQHGMISFDINDNTVAPWYLVLASAALTVVLYAAMKRRRVVEPQPETPHHTLPDELPFV